MNVVPNTHHELVIIIEPIKWIVSSDPQISQYNEMENLLE
jgi:hypothetical protein